MHTLQFKCIFPVRVRDSLTVKHVKLVQELLFLEGGQFISAGEAKQISDLVQYIPEEVHGRWWTITHSLR